jgi:hypothetical protein
VKTISNERKVEYGLEKYAIVPLKGESFVENNIRN